jgi:valyl-tRNA synthetase
VLAHAFDGGLRLLQPIVPFITEELWQKLPQTPSGAFLAQASWPVASGMSAGKGRDFEFTREAVQAIRQVRAEYNVNPGAWVDAILVAPENVRAVLEAQAPIVGSLARAKASVAATPPGGAAAQVLLSAGIELVVPLAGMIDLEKEKQRVQTELAQLEKQTTALAGRLGNESFVAKAPPAVVDGERAKLADWQSRAEQLRSKLAAFDA